jgi:NAD(P)-dependent dehydrogenase (short-subunit alcohol dehydrogenase family)
MQLSLDGKVALVTGASRGIGRAIAAAYAESGAKVMLSSRKQADLEKAAAEMQGDVAVFAAHAGDPDQAKGCVAATVERFGGLDVLVNNAATNPYFGPLIEVDLPRWDKIFEVNLRGPLVWIQEAWKEQMNDHGGSIINLASVGGMTYGGYIGAYDITKAGVIHMTKHLATELGPRVRVNAIAPGLVKTDMARALWDNELGEQIAKRWPLGRLGEPGDIAGAAVFLASDAAAWITGHVLVVDGGGMLEGFATG